MLSTRATAKAASKRPTITPTNAVAKQSVISQTKSPRKQHALTPTDTASERQVRIRTNAPGKQPARARPRAASKGSTQAAIASDSAAGRPVRSTSKPPIDATIESVQTQSGSDSDLAVDPPVRVLSGPFVIDGDSNDDFEEAILGDGSSVFDDRCDAVDDDTSEEDDDGSANFTRDNSSVQWGGQAAYCTQNPVVGSYIRSMTNGSGLQLVEGARIRRAYNDHGELGLFTLFITNEFKERIQGWTNEGLRLRGQLPTTDNEFNAYIGLELAMSICPLNDIAEFWSEKKFIGQHDFSATMSRTRFQTIRSRVKFHPIDASSGDGKDTSRGSMQHIQTKFAQIAVPFGTSSLDENSVRTKARTRAKSFIPSKPDKYAIRFYAVVAWKSLYVHSIWDNGSGNLTKTTPASRYTRVFPSLATLLGRTLDDPDVVIQKKSASALWVAMMGHQASLSESPSGRRLMVTDNFYTRHALANALKTFTDGETRMLGTVRENNVDKLSKKAVADSIARVNQAPRCTWELIAILEREPGYSGRKKEHALKRRAIPASHRSAFHTAEDGLCSPFRLYHFPGQKMVIIYTNDLHATPPQLTMDQNDPIAIECVHGLCPIRRWTGQENLHRKTFMVPTVIAAYNLGMNGVDRVDQLRATNPTRRKEMRLSMSIFTWALDLCVIHAFALFNELQLSGSRSLSLRAFKRRIAEQLTAPQFASTSLL